MDRQELIDEYLKITDVNKDIAVIYDLLDKLGLKYKKTACKRCRKDFKNLIAEELGLIEDAAEESDFNSESDEGYVWVWNGGRAVSWNGHIMNADTPQEIISEYIKVGGDRFYHLEKNEETINNQE